MTQLPLKIYAMRLESTMKTYKLVFSKDFHKILPKLDKTVQKLVLSYIKKYLENTDNPRARGKALVGDKKGYWRYRIGDYRLIVEIHDDELIIVALTFGHRKNVYKDKM